MVFIACLHLLVVKNSDASITLFYCNIKVLCYSRGNGNAANDKVPILFQTLQTVCTSRLVLHQICGLLRKAAVVLLQLCTAGSCIVDTVDCANESLECVCCFGVTSMRQVIGSLSETVTLAIGSTSVTESVWRLEQAQLELRVPH